MALSPLPWRFRASLPNMSAGANQDYYPASYSDTWGNESGHEELVYARSFVPLGRASFGGQHQTFRCSLLNSGERSATSVTISAIVPPVYVPPGVSATAWRGNVVANIVPNVKFARPPVHSGDTPAWAPTVVLIGYVNYGQDFLVRLTCPTIDARTGAAYDYSYGANLNDHPWGFTIHLHPVAPTGRSGEVRWLHVAQRPK